MAEDRHDEDSADRDLTHKGGTGIRDLFAAAVQGNVEVVQALLSQGADFNKSDGHGRTALFLAAGQGNLEVVQALLSHGADVNKSDIHGRTALFSAAIRGNVEVVQALLSRGADVNEGDIDGETALLVAAGQGNVEVVQALLSHGADVNKSDKYGRTALFSAAIGGNVEVVQALLSRGADVNKSDKVGRTALSSPVLQGNVEVVKALLSHGADVNKSDEDGETALFVSMRKGNVEVVQALLKHGAEVNNSDESGKAGRGMDVNAVNSSGNSALFYTIHLIETGQSGDAVVRILQLLLQYGADFSIINAAGENVLLYALSFAKREGMKADQLPSLCVFCHFLIGEGNVNVNARPEGGITAIHLVLQLMQHYLNEKVPSLPLFQLASAILHSPTGFKTAASIRDDISGDTPLHLWASFKPKNHEYDQSLKALMEDLLAFGGQVNSANAVGETPLHVAQTWTAIKALLDKRAAPFVTDHYGNTPLISCIRNGALFNGGPWGSSISEPVPSDSTTTEGPLRTWNQLFQYRFDPLRSNHKGETPLSLLLESAKFDFIQAFLKATTALKLHKYLVDSNGDPPLHVICRDENKDNFWKLNLIDFLIQSEPSIVNVASRKGETALHIACQRDLVGSLSLELIQRLRVYGARMDTPDLNSQTCFDLASEKPGLMKLLEQEIDLFEVEPWLPWTSKSEKHKMKLGQVARGQNSEQTGSLCYHREPIGLGAFGRVHVGINSKDGREVAVKCVERARMCRPEDRNEVKKLLELADCEHVVRYLSYHGDKDFLYIVLELMEGTLEELLDEGVGKDDEVRLCRCILEGVNFLHERNIVHRDIKPTNVLYKCEPNLCVKLADFGLSGRATQTVANTFSVMHSKAGTRCWMAPELLTKDAQHTPASDMFACGLLLHFVLSGKKHPFAPTNSAHKSEQLIECETVTNIEKRALSLDASAGSHASRGCNVAVCERSATFRCRVFEASSVLVEQQESSFHPRCWRHTGIRGSSTSRSLSLPSWTTTGKRVRFEICENMEQRNPANLPRNDIFEEIKKVWHQLCCWPRSFCEEHIRPSEPDVACHEEKCRGRLRVAEEVPHSPDARLPKCHEAQLGQPSNHCNSDDWRVNHEIPSRRWFVVVSFSGIVFMLCCFLPAFRLSLRIMVCWFSHNSPPRQKSW